MHRRTLFAAGLAAASAPARAQAFPDRPVGVVVGFIAGGSTDIAARLLIDRMAPRLGPQARMLVENRPGAGGSVAAEYVSRQNPDGHLLMVASASSHGTNPAALPDTVRYDTLRDFTPIAYVGGGPMLVVVPGGSPHADLRSLLRAARAAASPMLWASSGSGGIGHLTGELLLHRAAELLGGGGPVKGEYVPYRGGAAVLEAMKKKEVDFSVEVLASAYPHVRDGSSLAVAVCAPTRHPLLPQVPTVIEQGIPGFEIITWNLLLGPRGMPPGVVERLSDAALSALAEPELRARMASVGVDPGPPLSPAQTGEYLAAELEKFRDIVARTGLRMGRG